MWVRAANVVVSDYVHYIRTRLHRRKVLSQLTDDWGVDQHPLLLTTLRPTLKDGEPCGVKDCPVRCSHCRQHLHLPFMDLDEYDLWICPSCDVEARCPVHGTLFSLDGYCYKCGF